MLTPILSCAVNPEDLDLEFDDWDYVDPDLNDMDIFDTCTHFVFLQHLACRNLTLEYISTFDEDSFKDVRGRFLRGDGRLYQVLRARFSIDRAAGIFNRLDWPHGYYGAGKYQATTWIRCPDSEVSHPCQGCGLTSTVSTKPPIV